MKFLRKWGALMVVLGVLAVGLGTLVWYTSRPVVLDPAKLTPAETVESYPKCALSLELAGRSIPEATFCNGALINLTFSNHSDAQLESGASVDGDRNLFFTGGLQVLLEGQWYEVPSEEYATAGVGLELEPGDSISGQYSLSPYGTLADGQYRIAFGYWQGSPSEDDPLLRQPRHCSYAEFSVEDERYVTSEG